MILALRAGVMLYDSRSVSHAKIAFGKLIEFSFVKYGMDISRPLSSICFSSRKNSLPA